MDKNKKFAAVIVAFFMVTNIWTTLSLKEQVKNLESEMGRMNSYLSNEVRYTTSSINNMKNDLLNKIEKGESLLSAFETEVEYQDAELEVTINLVPKEKRNNEKVFLSLGNEKQEIISVNGTEFTGTFGITMPQEIVPTVTFESSTGIRQEVLPEIDLNEFLSLKYQSAWNTEDSPPGQDNGIFFVFVSARDEKSSSLLSEESVATVVIQDTRNNSVIGREDMQLTENYLPFNERFGEEMEGIAFTTDLNEYFVNIEGAYIIWLELQTQGGVFYREQVASFRNYDKYGHGRSAGSGILHPAW